MIYEKGYVTKLGHHCFNSCLVNYLNYKGIDVDEYDIFLKSKGYEIERFEDNKFIYKILNNSIEKLTDLGIKYEQVSFEDRYIARETLVKYVYDEKLVTVFLNTNTLTYNSAFSHSGENLHCVNVIGIDENNDKVMISDGYIAGYKGSCYEDWISIDELLLAWGDAKFTCFIYDMDDVKKDSICTYDLSDCISQFLSDDERVYESLSEELQRIYILNDDKMSEGLMKFNMHIRVGGLIFVRNYFLGIIKKLSSDESLVNEYDAVCKEWNIISSMLIKCAYLKDKSKLDEISDKIQKLFVQEKDILKSTAKMIL